MIIGPITRIVVRYGIGTVLGASVATAILLDEDLMALAGFAVATAGGWLVERIYMIAKKRKLPL